MIESHKEALGRYFEHIYVMESMKPLEMLPVLNVLPISMVAAYLEIPKERIRNYHGKHTEEMESVGCKRLYLSDFKNAGYKVSSYGKQGTHLVEYGDIGIAITNAGARCLSKEAIFMIAMNVAGEFPKKIQADVNKKITMSNSTKNTKNNVNVEIVDNSDTSNVTVIPGTIPNDIFSFDNPEFDSIRVLSINNVPWFVGKDVAFVLGYSDISHAILDHVDPEDRVNSKTQGRFDPEFGQRGTWLINESGLYSLIMSSRLPSKKKFKRWVTSEVLPSIRKHGVYMTPKMLEAAILNPDFVIKILMDLKDERRKNEELSEIVQTQSETIKVFADEINTWDSRSVINALIRSYAANCFNGNFSFAFNNFYKQFDYKYHTRLKLRKNIKHEKKAILDCLNPTELNDALKLAISICETNGIDVAAVVNSVNLSVYST